MHGMKNKDVRVAIIDNSIDKNIYDPVSHWSAFLDVPWSSFQAKKDYFPAALGKDFTHIILTGSEASIMDRPQWVLDEIEFVKESVSKEIPIMGSCYGHQMIALALAGPSCVRRSFSPEIGWIPIKIIRESVILGKKGLFFSFTIHFDEVFGIGSDFDILASTSLCPIHAFRKKGKPVWGIQSHPEITPDSGKILLKKLIEEGKGPIDVYTEAYHSLPKDSRVIKHIIDAFIHC
jgi:GMP synthase-like glutamine amidotransferase